MKKLLFICTILLLYSCSIMKNKSKQKQMLKATVQTEITTDSAVKSNENQVKKSLDSSTQKSQFNIAKAAFSDMQKFDLKNNGKCADPGLVRFVEVTDSKGNKTSIPVNDNTDLNFGTESKTETEIADLKIENSVLKKENDSIVKNNESLQNSSIQQSADLISKSLELDLKTKSSPLSAFIWVGLLSIAGWELLKFYLKKQNIL